MPSDTRITPEQLRQAAQSALELHEFLDRCGREGVLWLIGFDLDYLAAQFTEVADRKERSDAV
jgi:hypothetical protein